MGGARLREVRARQTRVILDTNILLRLIDGAASPQYKKVRTRLEAALKEGQRLRVDVATIHEVVYVLSSKATGYGYSRPEVAAAVHSLIHAPELTIDRPDALYRAATDYGRASIDFHDCYLAALATESPDEQVYSLDTDFKKLE
jgi:predicted nucleic acid-binding protein